MYQAERFKAFLIELVKDQMARRLGLKIKRLQRVDFFEPLLFTILETIPDFYFIQIGANDGKTHDQIYSYVTRYNVQGLVVEPLPDMYKQLCHNYRKFPGIIKVNAAIHANEREVKIFRVDPNKGKKLPYWSQGIASLDKDHHKRSGIPSEYIIEETVHCITFNELLTTYNANKIDLLQVDTEGYDYNIIDMINFDEIKPLVIRFEHCLGENKSFSKIFNKTISKLHSEGYLVAVEKFDVIAYLNPAQCPELAVFFNR